MIKGSNSSNDDSSGSGSNLSDQVTKPGKSEDIINESGIQGDEITMDNEIGINPTKETFCKMELKADFNDESDSQQKIEDQQCEELSKLVCPQKMKQNEDEFLRNLEMCE